MNYRALSGFGLVLMLIMASAGQAGAQEVDALMNKAASLAAHGNLKRAMQTYQDAHSIDPMNVDALFSLVQIADALEYSDDVLLYGQSYLVLAPDDIDRPEVEKKMQLAKSRIFKVARLKLTIYPAEAEVFINSVYLGKGGAEIFASPGKKLQLKADLVDYVSMDQELRLGEGEEKSMSKQLEKIVYKGKLKISIVPDSGVDVYVDTVKMGRDHFSMNLVEGKHLVCFSKSGYDRWWRYVEIPRNGSYDLDVTMEEATAPIEPCNVYPPDDY